MSIPDIIALSLKIVNLHNTILTSVNNPKVINFQEIYVYMYNYTQILQRRFGTNFSKMKIVLKIYM